MKSKVLDDFNCNLYCPYCEIVTEHNVQKVDEQNENCVGYYGECDVCQEIREVGKLELIE